MYKKTKSNLGFQIWTFLEITEMSKFGKPKKVLEKDSFLEGLDHNALIFILTSKNIVTVFFYILSRL